MMKEKFKEKIVSSSIAETSKVFKRLAALIIFLAFFTLSLIVLFQIGDISLKLPVVKKYIWLIEMLLILWYASRFSIKNIKKAYFSMYASYLMGAILIGYCAAMVGMTYDYQPKDWLDLEKLFIWLTPIVSLNALWKLMFALVEKNVRPFFAQKMWWALAVDLLVISIMWVVSYMFDTFIIAKEKFDLENTTHMLLSFYLIAASIAIAVLNYILVVKYWKYGEYGREATKKMMLWNSFMKLGSITIWFLIRDKYVHISLQWWIMTGVSGLLLIILLLFAFSKRHAGGRSKIYVFMSASIISVLAIGMFAMENWWGVNSLNIVPILLVAYSLIYLLNVIIEPSTSWWIARSFANVASAIAVYVLLDWAFGDYFGNDMSKLPFSINELVVIPLLAAVTVLEVSSIAVAWKRYNTIARAASKIIKLENSKGVNHE